MDLEKAGAPSFDLSGKVALVTGAGRGLGAQIALALGAYGADIVVADRTLAETEETREAVKALGRRSFPVEADLASVPAIQAMVAKAEKEFGHIDILVNNAGLNITQWAVDVTEQAWDTVLGVNLKGVFFCSQAVGRIMIRQKQRQDHQHLFAGRRRRDPEAGRLLLEQGGRQPADQAARPGMGAAPDQRQRRRPDVP